MTTSLSYLPKGRPRELDPDDAIQNAMEVFWARGYHGTSLPDLLAATGLSRSSLYATFGDQHGLLLQALDRYIAEALARLGDELDPRRSAWEGVRRFLAGYVQRNGGTAGRKGCLVHARRAPVPACDPRRDDRNGWGSPSRRPDRAAPP